ncbi:hypothetical protein A4A49_16215 [Nicotiana attenuata]|uniref:Uncharacterized protein n=1 Tax=Nicotiana attenuata TaxID=49451 RepID=A0A1J6IDU6_NICAT|nr:hypothetical protein A4A49_16215 [Nicotiana attenuata]
MIQQRSQKLFGKEHESNVNSNPCEHIDNLKHTRNKDFIPSKLIYRIEGKDKSEKWISKMNMTLTVLKLDNAQDDDRTSTGKRLTEPRRRNSNIAD